MNTTSRLVAVRYIKDTKPSEFPDVWNCTLVCGHVQPYRLVGAWPRSLRCHACEAAGDFTHARAHGRQVRLKEGQT